MLPDKRQYCQMNERTDEGNKSIGVKTDISHLHKQRFEHRFKRKYAYLT